jgi:hypothetical protein
MEDDTITGGEALMRQQPPMFAAPHRRKSKTTNPTM